MFTVHVKYLLHMNAVRSFVDFLS